MYELIIASALLAWTHGTVPTQTIDTWSEAIASVCASEEECVQLAAQAFVESRFAPEVLDGRCNDAAWRAQQRSWWRSSCDGGLAVGPWQIHDARLLGASPELQASVALNLMRRAPRLWTTWRAARSQAARWLTLPRGRAP